MTLKIALAESMREADAVKNCSRPSTLPLPQDSSVSEEEQLNIATALSASEANATRNNHAATSIPSRIEDINHEHIDFVNPYFFDNLDVFNLMEIRRGTVVDPEYNNSYITVRDEKSWYEVDTILTLLSELFKNSGAIFTYVCNIGDENGATNLATSKKIVEDAVIYTMDHPGTFVGIPLRIGADLHWTCLGIILEKDKDGIDKVHFNYCDSFGRDIPLKLRNNIINEIILEQGLFDPKITYNKIRQQYDGANCGPFMATNLALMAKKELNEKLALIGEIYQNFTDSQKEDFSRKLGLKCRKQHLQIFQSILNSPLMQYYINNPHQQSDIAMQVMKSGLLNPEDGINPQRSSSQSFNSN